MLSQMHAVHAHNQIKHMEAWLSCVEHFVHGLLPQTLFMCHQLLLREAFSDLIKCYICHKNTVCPFVDAPEMQSKCSVFLPAG